MIWMKVVVTGASSLPGFRVALEALNRNHEVIALHKENPIPIDDPRITKVRLDIRDAAGLKKIFFENKPDVIVHAAALGDVDRCERDKKLAWDVNVNSTKVLAHHVAKYSSFLVYLSTDYVFDGEKGNYHEGDPPNPVNYYGLTKLMGEVACMSGTIARASSIYGFGPGRKNFAKYLVEKLEKNEPVKAITDQYTSPTQATLLAKAVLEIIEKRLTGIFHIAGERMSRYEFALKVADALDLDESLIQREVMEGMKWFAKRPRDSSLNAGATKKELKTDFYSTEKAMKTLREEYKQEQVVK